MEKKCTVCKKAYSKGRIGLKQFQKSKYCSAQCRFKAISGKENPHWKGGEFVREDGYILVRIGILPQSHRGKRYELKHRIVMETHLGRKLLRTEVVHHLNGKKDDNRIQNLEIITQAEHARKHDEERGRNKKGQFI